MLYVTRLIITFLAFMASTTQAFACDKEPVVTFGTRPFDAAEPNGGTMEFVIVDGVAWKHAYWKSAILGIAMQDILPDCRVIAVGRKGLSFYVIIDDEEWSHGVYNSSFVIFSSDGKSIAHIGAKDLVVNDAPQQMTGILQKATFNEAGDLLTVWKQGDDMVERTIRVAK